MWFTEGLYTNAGAGDIAADSGPLDAGTYPFTLTFWTDSPHITIDFVRRNAADDADVGTQRFIVDRGVLCVPMPVTVAQGERVLVRLVDPVPESCQCSLMT
jgi:hypothetical protein